MDNKSGSGRSKNNNLAHLKKLFALCRANGIASFTQGDLSIEFGEKPMKPSKRNQVIKDDYSIETDELSPEDLLFYSSSPTSSLDAEDKE